MGALSHIGVLRGLRARLGVERSRWKRAKKENNRDMVYYYNGRCNVLVDIIAFYR